jgi:hypothetical protein
MSHNSLLDTEWRRFDRKNETLLLPIYRNPLKTGNLWLWHGLCYFQVLTGKGGTVMKTSFFKWLLEITQRILIIAILAGVAFYLFSGRLLPVRSADSGRPGASSYFSESSLIDKISQIEVSGSSFMARTEAKRLIREGITSVKYHAAPTPTLIIRVRCGVYKGHEATWKEVLDHYARYYCNKENIPAIEASMINCENRVLTGGRLGFED